MSNDPSNLCATETGSDIFSLGQNGLSADDAKLYALLPKDAKILFAHPLNYGALPYLVKNRKNAIYVLDVDMQNAPKIGEFGGVFLQGDLHKIAELTSLGEFDVVVMDESLLLYNDVVGALRKATSVGGYCVVSIKNESTFRDRLRFLLSGRFVPPDQAVKWYQKSFAHRCCPQEFIEMCVANKMVIERACFYDHKMEVHTIYSFLKLPSLRADKFFFVVRRAV